MYDEFLNFIFPLAKGAGEIQLAYFRGDDLGIETKSNAYDVVTRADKESEAYIVQAILGRYPGHGILGEEGGVMGTAGSDYRWVIDPLDGTTNYSQGLPIFSVSIALQHNGETVVGVVYAPYLGELFWASKGGGAYMKSRSGEVKRLQVSAKQTLATSVLATGFPYDKDVNPDNNSDNVARIVPYVRDIRRLGSAAYDLTEIYTLSLTTLFRSAAGRLLGAGFARVGCLCREPDRAGSRGRRLRFQAQPRCLAGRGQRGARRGDAQIYPIGRAARGCDGRQPLLRGADIRFASRFLRPGGSCPFAANGAKLCPDVLFYLRRESVFKIFSYFWQDKNFENECVGL